MNRTMGGLELIALTASGVLCQQAAAPSQFVAASVRLVSPRVGFHAVGLRISHGRATLEAATLRQMIVQAYQVQRVLVQGGPAWYDDDQYDVVANAASADATAADIRVMLQNLLADKFKLAVHRETKEVTMYSLTLGKGGAKLHEAPADEATAMQQDEKGGIVFRRQPVATLVNTLANRLESPVVNMTGLNGLYDYRLELGLDPTGSAVLTAVQEQLGLKLDGRQSPLQVLIVDHADRPSAN
jgi:uncharacterized protein (TIGR03435 family)